MGFLCRSFKCLSYRLPTTAHSSLAQSATRIHFPSLVAYFSVGCIIGRDRHCNQRSDLSPFTSHRLPTQWPTVDAAVKLIVQTIESPIIGDPSSAAHRSIGATLLSGSESSRVSASGLARRVRPYLD